MYQPNYEFIILKNEAIVIALPKPPYGAFSYEIDALESQGYVYCNNVWAKNAVDAVAIFSANEKFEINQLKKEILRLEHKIEEVLKENDILKRKSTSPDESSSFKYYEILGFSELPNAEDFKKRYRKLCQILHTDRGGDKELFQLVQQAHFHFNKIHSG